MSKSNWCGIDYGSKLAGTTCICYQNADGVLEIKQSQKEKDADLFIADFMELYKPDFVMIDAPLSLPDAYYNNNASDFMYRKADRETRAMSPMFLGGLTARAMQIRRKFSSISFYETYPAALIKHLQWNEFYIKKQNQPSHELLLLAQKNWNINLPSIYNMHQFDALLAWYSGFRLLNKQAVFFGNEQEGGIWI